MDGSTEVGLNFDGDVPAEATGCIKARIGTNNEFDLVSIRPEGSNELGGVAFSAPIDEPGNDEKHPWPMPALAARLVQARSGASVASQRLAGNREISREEVR
jgi:hypothetical protein